MTAAENKRADNSRPKAAGYRLCVYIDKYEHYCEKNPEYPNSRAEIAIENIREVYKVRLKKRDFLQDEDKKEVAEL